jgi:hypothetical protein
VPHPNVAEIIRSQPHSGFATLRWDLNFRDPLKPGFGLTGDVQISAILSSCPKQITAKAMTKNYE